MITKLFSSPSHCLFHFVTVQYFSKMEFSRLSVYEKEVINKMIPLFKTESAVLRLYSELMNIIYADHFMMVNNKIISHRQLGEITSRVLQFVLDFLKENEFIRKQDDGSFVKLSRAEELVRAGSIDRLYSGTTPPGSSMAA